MINKDKKPITAQPKAFNSSEIESLAVLKPLLKEKKPEPTASSASRSLAAHKPALK